MPNLDELPEDQGLAAALRGYPGHAQAAKNFHNTLASLLRGAVTGTVGAPGDIEQAIKDMLASRGGQPAPRVLPTSEDVSSYLPPTNLKDEAYKQIEHTGQMVPTNIGQAGAKALSAALKGGAAKTAVFWPVITGQKADRLRRAERAAELEKKGASPQDVWDETLLMKVDEPLKHGTNEPAIYASEHTPDYNPRLKPGMEMSKQEKHKVAKHNLDRAAELKSQGYMPDNDFDYHMQYPETGELDRFLHEVTVPKPQRDIPLGQLMEHPVFKEEPLLANMPTTIYRKGAGPAALKDYADKESSLGMFDPDETRIILGGKGLTHMGFPQFEPMSIVEHELQHGIQDLLGLPKGGSPNWNTPEDLEFFMRRIPAISAALRRTGNPRTEAFVRQLEGISNNPNVNYLNLAGEREARLAAERMLTKREQGMPMLMSDESEGKPISLDADLIHDLLRRTGPGAQLQRPTDLADYIVKNYGSP